MQQKLRNMCAGIALLSILLYGCGNSGNSGSSPTPIAATTVTCDSSTPGSTISVNGQNYLVVESGTGTYGANNPTNLANLSNGSIKYCTSLLTNLQGLFNNSNFNQPIDNWDTSHITDMSNLFESNSTFNQPINSWDTSNVTNMSNMFHGASSFNQPINSWNTSSVTTVASMFESASSFNQAIDTNQVIVSRTRNNTVSLQSTNYTAWDTSSMTDMSRMFMGSARFNQSLENWDTSNVTNMSRMFHLNVLFNHPLNKWNTGKVRDMSWMFSGAHSFSRPLENWDTSNVTNMSEMFSENVSFDQPLANWNTGNVTDMSSMFSYTKNFNQPLANWNTSKVINMSSMFYSSEAFNQPLANWNTSNVTNMRYMFSFASSFNQPLANWNTSNVTDMYAMFNSATSFNQSLANWNTGNVTNMSYMLYGATAFNQNLSAWNVAKITVAPQGFNASANSEWTSNQSYQPVWGAPVPVVTMTQPNPSTNVSTKPSIQLTFTQAVNNVDSTNVQLHSGSTSGPVIEINSITANSSSGSTIGNTVFTLSPKAELVGIATYYITVNSSPTTSYGKSVVATNFNFTTGDFTAPTVAMTTPLNGAINVSTSPSIQLQFSKAVNNVNSTNVQLHSSSSSGPVVAIGTITAGASNTYSFSPLSAISDNTSYYVVVGSGITDASGNALQATTFNFTTTDTITPTVSMITPANGATGVSISPSIQVKFSEAVKNVNSTNVQLHSGSSSGPTIAIGDITAGSDNTYSFSPVAALADNTTYYIVVGSGVTDISGNALQTTIFNFITGDYNAPTVTMLNPTDGSTGVSTSPTIQLQFDEPVNNVNSTNVKLRSASGGEVTIGNITAGLNNTYSFSPSGSLATNTKYVVGVLDGITDAAGHPIVTKLFSFTTADTIPHIFVTASTYTGDLGGVTGANDKCNADANKLSGYTYKALVMSRLTQPGTSAWPLAANTTYYRGSSLATAIGKTDETGIFNFLTTPNLSNAISASGDTAWTGIVVQTNGDDQYSWISGGREGTTACGAYDSSTHYYVEWTVGTSSRTGVDGVANSTTETAFVNSTTSCPTMQHLYCVSQ